MSPLIILCTCAIVVLLGCLVFALFTIRQLKKENDTFRAKSDKFAEENSKYATKIGILQNKVDLLQKSEEERQNEHEIMSKQLKETFQNMANEILEDRSKQFDEQSTKQLNALLNPLSDKMQEFKRTVEETYIKGVQERSAITAELQRMRELNTSLQQEASNLTNALKRDPKKQGCWGEMILEKVLEASGLEKDREYVLQKSFSEEEQRLIPDAIVYLPEDKMVIIDSKVSLTAYERFVNAQDEETAAQAMKEHLTSLKQHVKELSDKDYATKLSGKCVSPEYVLLFVPIESALSAAMQYEQRAGGSGSLYEDAWKKRIVIVTPSTLIATLMTIAYMWKQDKQSKNAMEIARRGALLLQKFNAFLNEMNAIGKSLNGAQQSYDRAMKKLTSEDGNLVRQAEMLQELGVKSKAIDKR